MRIAKSIDELWEEAKGFDCVLTTDAALATALNGRIAEPRIGRLAYTPKQVAAMTEHQTIGRPAMSDLEIIAQIRKDNDDLDFRTVYSEMTAIREIRRHTADVAKYLHSDRARRVWESYRLLPTKEKSMEAYSCDDNYFFKGKKVAVIGLDFFNDLDKHMLSGDFEEIDLFKDGDYEIDKIYSIGNDRQIADCIADIIKGCRPTDAAVVLNPSGTLADAVRAALYRNRIPFKNDLSVKDLAQVRDYIQFVTLALDFRTVRVKDVRDLFTSLHGISGTGGRHLTPYMDNFLLSRLTLSDPGQPGADVSDPRTKALIETMRGIRGLTFGEALSKAFDTPELRRRGASVEILLHDLGLYDEKITGALAEDLSYAVDNVEDLKHNEQIPDSEKQGVLLADCRNALYVDRPLVIFAGADRNWDVDESGKEYIDQETAADLQAERMAVLLQQGDARIIAVRPATGGEETCPCRHIADLMAAEGKSADTFGDICSELKTGSWHIDAPADRDRRKSLGSQDAPADRVKFSKTAYNRFAECRAAYLLGQFLDTEENDKLFFGTSMHEFAELYLLYPETVREKGTEYFLDRMSERYAGISSECLKRTDRDKMKFCMGNLMKFIDSFRPASVPRDGNPDRKYPNSLMEAEDLEEYSSCTETEMDCKDLPAFAKYDYQMDNLIIDYKTGQSHKPSEIVKGMTPGGLEGHAEFQPEIYLSVLSRSRGFEDASFKLFFMADNDIESTSPGFDVEQNVRTVKLSRRIRAEILTADDSPAKEYQKWVVNSWPEVSDILKRYFAGMDEEQAMKEMAIVTKKAPSTIEKFFKFCQGPALYSDRNGTVVIPADAMEEFCTKLEADSRNAGEIMDIPIVAAGPGKRDCGKCDYRSVCPADQSGEADTEEQA
ncbi:PD-(D/E)XK nuclease family protein [Methanomassiliicoccales archaeon LGM-DZ1]|nr:PD-(D/E)XK nuclease family protein [Methanomassiliicoccales archaeon LGM-DZ1]